MTLTMSYQYLRVHPLESPHRNDSTPEVKSGRPPIGAPSLRESSCRLPYEIVETIISHLTYDHATLAVCSLTCRSWHIAAIPHLYRTFTLRDVTFRQTRRKLKPLSRLHKLRRLALVENLVVHQRQIWFTPLAFSASDPLYFSGFTNLQTMKIFSFCIDTFIPGIERHFGQFPPTLRSISLINPVSYSSHRLAHFLSLFPNLDDIEIHNFSSFDTHAPNMVPVPSSVPKLRGRLRLDGFQSVETWNDLIYVCDGLRFRHMDLRGVKGCWAVLLRACAGTLETLRIYLSDHLG